LPSYVAALRRGYSPSAHRPSARLEELREVESDEAAFLERRNDPAANIAAIRLPDGSTVPRIPGFQRWLWDGDFAGSIGLRWQPGTPELPRWCLGHVGYGVVPWKRRRGYATTALRLMLPEARHVGLPYVEVVADLENVPSQRVILANGGTLIETFEKIAAYGNGKALRYRITL
jgi:predicted acetyltransferase